MNQQPDKFIREKLEGFQKTAPSLAWEKIEAGLDKKNNKGLWLKIAAAVLLLAVSSFVLWTYRNPSVDTESLTAKKEVQKVIAPDQKTTNTTDAVADKEISNPEKTNTEQAPIRKPGRKAKSPVVHEEVQTPREEVTIAGTEPGPSVPVINEATDPDEIKTDEAVAVVVPVVENSADTEETVTIVYSAEEVNEKYLDKDALAKATSKQNKPSTFRKLLEKAYDLKNNQDPFGDLRQKKNEILALNFKSEKRSQNK